MILTREPSVSTCPLLLHSLLLPEVSVSSLSNAPLHHQLQPKRRLPRIPQPAQQGPQSEFTQRFCPSKIWRCCRSPAPAGPAQEKQSPFPSPPQRSRLTHCAASHTRPPFFDFQALVEKARENVTAPPLQAGRVSKETVFKRADARGGGDASAGARLAAHKQQQQQQQQQQRPDAVGGLDGARIKANQIANLRLMAVLNYRLASLP
jgi:hypothetical protein